MDKNTEKARPSSDPCAADHVIVGDGGRLTLRVRFDPFALLLAVPARDGSTTDVPVTNQTVRYEFREAVELILEIDPPPDVRVEARQRTGTRDWTPLEPIAVPNNDRCTPIEYLVWDATQPQPEPQPNALPQMQIKARKHSPKTGTSKVPKKDT